MTKRTARRTEDNEGVNGRNAYIARYGKETKAREVWRKEDKRWRTREREREKKMGTLRKPICPFISGRLN